MWCALWVIYAVGFPGEIACPAKAIQDVAAASPIKADAPDQTPGKQLVLQSYPVGDIAFRLEKGQRTFFVVPLVDDIQSRIAVETWDEVGGPGLLKACEKSQTLEVLQTPDIHVEITALLEKLRKTKKTKLRKSKLRCQEMDLVALYWAVEASDGFFCEKEIRANAISIQNKATRSGEIYAVMGDTSFTDAETLIKYLSAKPAKALRDGVIWELKHHQGPILGQVVPIRFEAGADEVARQLQKYCQSRNVDLFMRLDYSAAAAYRGLNGNRVQWVVHATDSIYDDPK